MTVYVTLAETSLMLSLFVCFSQYQKLLPIGFPYQYLLIYWYRCSTYWLLQKERERERERERYKWPGKKLVTEEAGGPFKE